MIDKIVSRAPARVCLFGDHQDYLSLPIIATTIDRTIEVNAIRNNSRYFKIFKKDLGEQDDINIDNGLYFGIKNSYKENQNISVTGVTNTIDQNIKWEITKL